MARGEEPTVEMIARELGASASDVQAVLLNQKPAKIIQAPRSDAEAGELRRSHEPVDPAEDPETHLVRTDRQARSKDLILRALQDLDEVERAIVERRERGDSLKVIGVELHRDGLYPRKISRERVRQLEARAHGKMRKFILRAAGEGAVRELTRDD